MKIFVIGGCSVSTDDPGYAAQHQILTSTLRRLGSEIAKAGHDLVVCSPFMGSADIEVVQGAFEVLSDSHSARTAISFHYPNSPPVVSELNSLINRLSLTTIGTFPQNLTGNDAESIPSENDWLLCQLIAMEKSNAIVSIGGKPTGSANLLLLLAESRRKPIVPLTFLQGAADYSYQRRQYELQDRLSEKVEVLRDRTRVDEVLLLLELLTTSTPTGPTICSRKKFFLSYPRARPEEADFIEMILRRRNLVVFRDEREFGAGQQLLGEIDEYIHQADVFVAVWCREYACSPWCFDELSLAMQRKAAGKLEVWLFCIDDTRIVPPDARSIISYPIVGRNEIERQLLVLLEDRPVNTDLRGPA